MGDSLICWGNIWPQDNLVLEIFLGLQLIQRLFPKRTQSNYRILVFFPFNLLIFIPCVVNGQWKGTKKYQDVLDPMNGEKFMTMPDTDLQELDEFAESLKKCPKSGLHNPLKNPERYLLYGEVCRKASELMNKVETDYS